MDELKPCPFCGEKAIITSWIDGFKVGCMQTFTCRGGTSSSRYYETEEEAVEEWNRRADDE